MLVRDSLLIVVQIMNKSDTIELLIALGKIAAFLMSIHFESPIVDNVRKRMASTILKWQKSVSSIYLMTH